MNTLPIERQIQIINSLVEGDQPEFLYHGE
jgi:hypothetical protein